MSLQTPITPASEPPPPQKSRPQRNIGATRNDRSEHARDVARAMLAIAVDPDHVIVPGSFRVADACTDRPAHAQTLRQCQPSDAKAG